MQSIHRKLMSRRLDASGAEPIKRAVKEAFHWPGGKSDSRGPDGDSSAWQTYSRAEPRSQRSVEQRGWHWDQAGLSGGKEEITQTAPLPLRSKERLAVSAALEKLLLSGDGFHVNGSVNRRCVVALAARCAPSDLLLLGFN